MHNEESNDYNMPPEERQTSLNDFLPQPQEEQDQRWYLDRDLSLRSIDDR